MITLAATPIGNADDASGRLRTLLAEADVIAAEDTRKLHGLLGRLGIEARGRFITYHEHNEAARTTELIEAAQSGQHVVMVSDAGMPGISDPGFRLVSEAAAAGVPITVAPGPSAVVTALALSGLPTDRFCFEGFLPRKEGARARVLGALAEEKRTMVFYEAPHRIEATIGAMIEEFGAERAGAMCRELTKTYEEVTRGSLAEIQQRAQRGVKGEIVIVVAGAQGKADPTTLVEHVLSRVESGERMKDAAGKVAEAAGVSKRELYETVLRER